MCLLNLAYNTFRRLRIKFWRPGGPLAPHPPSALIRSTHTLLCLHQFCSQYLSSLLQQHREHSKSMITGLGSYYDSFCFSPQEFLKKEFSEENILFWQACEYFSHVPAADKKQVSLQCEAKPTDMQSDLKRSYLFCPIST